MLRLFTRMIIVLLSSPPSKTRFSKAAPFSAARPASRQRRVGAGAVHSCSSVPARLRMSAKYLTSMASSSYEFASQLQFLQACLRRDTVLVPTAKLVILRQHFPDLAQQDRKSTRLNS